MVRRGGKAKVARGTGKQVDDIFFPSALSAGGSKSAPKRRKRESSEKRVMQIRETTENQEETLLIESDVQL